MDEEYGLSKIDYTLYHQNLLRNDEYIKNHRDFEFRKTKMVMKTKINLKIFEKMKSDFVNYEDEKNELK